jgi:hypothetical protein
MQSPLNAFHITYNALLYRFPQNQRVRLGAVDILFLGARKGIAAKNQPASLLNLRHLRSSASLPFRLSHLTAAPL